MELKEDEVYSTKDMQDFFGVSKDTWKKKKDSLLFHLSNYFEYEIEYDSVDYRKYNYHIIKQLHEYEPPQRKSVKRDLTYENKIIEISNKLDEIKVKNTAVDGDATIWKSRAQEQFKSKKDNYVNL